MEIVTSAPIAVRSSTYLSPYHTLGSQSDIEASAVSLHLVLLLWSFHVAASRLLGADVQNHDKISRKALNGQL